MITPDEKAAMRAAAKELMEHAQTHPWERLEPIGGERHRDFLAGGIEHRMQFTQGRQEGSRHMAWHLSASRRDGELMDDEVAGLLSDLFFPAAAFAGRIDMAAMIHGALEADGRLYELNGPDPRIRHFIRMVPVGEAPS